MPVPRPRPWDLAFAVAGAAALVADGLTRGDAPAGVIVVLSVLAGLPLAWRSRAPVAALLASTLVTVACLAVFHPYDTAIFVVMIALYSVAVLGDRRRSLLVGAATAVFLVAVIVVISSDGEGNALGQTALRLVLALGALVVGDTVRSRRALLSAQRERDQRDAAEREEAARRRVGNERLRIARELHDTIAHALVAINVRAGVAAHLGPGQDVDAALRDIKHVSAQALDELRATLDLLREDGDGAEAEQRAPTAPAPDLGAVDQLIGRARAAGLDAEADVRLDGRHIPSSVGQAGFRIVQEALTNVLRHADASRATVSLRVASGALDLEVVDDGHGRLPAGAAGHGLQGMAERAAALGGDVAAGPALHGGWRVHAHLPLTTDRRA